MGCIIQNRPDFIYNFYDGTNIDTVKEFFEIIVTRLGEECKNIVMVLDGHPAHI